MSSEAQPVRYGSTISEVTGLIPVGACKQKVKPSNPGDWDSTALFCEAVTSPTFGTFRLLETYDQNEKRTTRQLVLRNVAISKARCGDYCNGVSLLHVINP